MKIMAQNQCITNISIVNYVRYVDFIVGRCGVK
jgi:hypothetical protein